MNLDWRRLKAVVLESDDWGLCAWSPDEQAHRALADGPLFRSAVGRRYGHSTLESASDLKDLTHTLLEFRGGDGFPPVWQANTVVASPDYERLTPPGFEVEELPLRTYAEPSSRWRRPGLWDEVTHAIDAGVWWPELHGLHHIPEHAWLTALRRGEPDARRAHEHQSPACQAVQGSGEYDHSEPEALRARNLALAIERFTRCFGRAPGSFCPPDYRWDDWLEEQTDRLGILVLQGKSEQAGAALNRVRRAIDRYRFPHRAGKRFYLPPRIAFEPSAGSDDRTGVEPVLRACREAWGRSQPAVISTHRANYADLDPALAVVGRAALRDLLDGLCRESAVFLTDAEVHALVERGWSVRAIGNRGTLLRYYGVPREPVRFAAPRGAGGVAFHEPRAAAEGSLTLDRGQVEARANVGEYLIEYRA